MTGARRALSGAPLTKASIRPRTRSRRHAPPWRRRAALPPRRRGGDLRTRAWARALPSWGLRWWPRRRSLAGSESSTGCLTATHQPCVLLDLGGSVARDECVARLRAYIRRERGRPSLAPARSTLGSQKGCGELQRHKRTRRHRGGPFYMHAAPQSSWSAGTYWWRRKPMTVPAKHTRWGRRR